MGKRFMVLQHMAWETPGLHLIDCVAEHDVRLDVVQVWREPIPIGRNHDGLIVLGGGPNVNEEDKYPFLTAEKEFIRHWVAQGQPYLGFCLGHQLLADALGGAVGPNFCRSVGFIEGHLTGQGQAHPLFRGLPKSFSLFKWHGQAVLHPLPKGVDVLVTSASCQIEAISLEDRPFIVGLQFDNHAATVFDVKAWLEADQEWLSRPPGADTSTILKDAHSHQSDMGHSFRVLFDNYLRML